MAFEVDSKLFGRFIIDARLNKRLGNLLTRILWLSFSNYAPKANSLDVRLLVIRCVVRPLYLTSQQSMRDSLHVELSLANFLCCMSTTVVDETMLFLLWYNIYITWREDSCTAH